MIKPVLIANGIRVDFIYLFTLLYGEGGRLGYGFGSYWMDLMLISDTFFPKGFLRLQKGHFIEFRGRGLHLFTIENINYSQIHRGEGISHCSRGGDMCPMGHHLKSTLDGFKYRLFTRKSRILLFNQMEKLIK